MHDKAQSVPRRVLHRGLDSAGIPSVPATPIVAPQEKSTVAAADVSQVDHRLRLPPRRRSHAPDVCALCKGSSKNEHTVAAAAAAALRRCFYQGMEQKSTKIAVRFFYDSLEYYDTTGVLLLYCMSVQITFAYYY